MAAGALVVIGASAGGVDALRAVMRGLPPDLDAAVLVVLHIPRTAPSALPHILSRAGPLPATHAVHGEPLLAGRVYVAPPDYHLLVMDGRIRLSRGPAENGHRPAADPLFRSAALLAEERTIAVVLSGSRDDGTAGAAEVRARGGRVLVQEPAETLYPSMPRSVIEHVGCDQVCPAERLGAAIADLVRALPEYPGWATDGDPARQVSHADRPQHDATDLAGPGTGQTHRSGRDPADRARPEASTAEAARRRGAPAMRHEQTEEWARQTSRLIRELIERWGSSGGWPHDGEPAG
jgi:hypothetical protein